MGLISDETEPLLKQKDELTKQVHQLLYDRVEEYTTLLFRVFPELASFDVEIAEDYDKQSGTYKYANVEEAESFMINGESEACAGELLYVGWALAHLFGEIYHFIDSEWLIEVYWESERNTRPEDLPPSTWPSAWLGEESVEDLRSPLGNILQQGYAEHWLPDDFDLWDLIKLADREGAEAAIAQVQPLHMEAVL